MSRSFNGTSNYIACGNPSLPSTVYSVGIWVRPTASTGTFFARENTTQSAPIYFELNFQSGTARMLVRDEANNLASSTKASAYSEGVWTHILGTRNGNDVLVYVNGVAGTLATTTLGAISSASPETDTVDIGGRTLGSSTRSVFLAGDAAEAAVWNVALTADDAVALASGISARKVRTSSLVFYTPLVENLQDMMGLTTLTNQGSGVAAHPRIIS